MSNGLLSGRDFWSVSLCLLASPIFAGFLLVLLSVLESLAFWGLLFCFGIILFQGKRWWRILLLVVSAALIVLIGPSRVYLGDHWPSDVLGSYLIGGVLLGVTLWLYLNLKARDVLGSDS